MTILQMSILSKIYKKFYEKFVPNSWLCLIFFVIIFLFIELTTGCNTSANDDPAQSKQYDLSIQILSKLIPDVSPIDCLHSPHSPNHGECEY